MKVKNRPMASHSDSQGRRQRGNGPPPPPPLVGNGDPHRISVHDRLDPPLTDNWVRDNARFRQQRSPVHQHLGGGAGGGGDGGRHEGSPHTVYSDSLAGDEYSQGLQSYDTMELHDNHQAIIPYESRQRKSRASRRNDKDPEGYPPEPEDIPRENANAGCTVDSRNRRKIPRERSVSIVVRHDDQLSHRRVYRTENLLEEDRQKVPVEKRERIHQRRQDEITDKEKEY